MIMSSPLFSVLFPFNFARRKYHCSDKTTTTKSVQRKCCENHCEKQKQYKCHTNGLMMDFHYLPIVSHNNNGTTRNRTMNISNSGERLSGEAANNSRKRIGSNSLTIFPSMIWKFLLIGFVVDSVSGLTLSTTSSDTRNYHPYDSNYHPAVSDLLSSHTIIRPKIHHGRHKRVISSTLEENGQHAHHITLEYVHNGKDVIVDLQLNDNLIPQGHFMRYQTPYGGSILKNFTKTDVDLCHYHGTIRNNKNSRVAVSTCDGIKGIVYDGVEMYHIDTKTPDGNINSDHLLYRHADMTQNTTCGYVGATKSKDINDKTIHMDSVFNNRILRYKRSTSDTAILGPYNANKHSSFVELVLVVDNKVYKALGENLKKVHSHCKDIANIINALYVPLNIFIALIGIVVWNENNEVELSSDGDKTLKNFLLYRRKVLIKDHPNDNAQLLTKEQFEGGVVGKALKGPICTYEFSGGVSMDHSQIVSVVATTVAHEMGHNFGMEHDTTDCKCIDDRCIMSASSSSVAPLHWSSCSIDQLNSAFHHGMNYCLRNRPTKLFESPQCGNGFVEPGEQCDCGLPQFCDNTCCNPHTCMLQTNASCATGECCDLSTCLPRTAGTICRTADGECDLPEYCTGNSEYCPADYFKRDTDSCDNGNAYCYNGSCRSHDDQCKILWGPSGQSSARCYSKNLDGTRHGNCGYDRIANTYKNCSTEDVNCGRVQCKHLSERLEFGMESVAVLSHSFIPYNNTIIPCRTAIVDLGLDTVDPGLAPDGAKCGDEKMCVLQKCVPLAELRANGIGVECPENCNGHGTCDNKGHCHCYKGFGPPLCNEPGPGGSLNSGPASNPNDGKAFVRILYVFFLGVVPFISCLGIGLYCWRQNGLAVPWEKTTTSPSNNVSKSNNRPPHHDNPSSLSSSLPTSTPSSTDDMNSSLLKTDAEAHIINDAMFGHFKGFTLKPLPNSKTRHLDAPNVAYVQPVTKPQNDEQSLTCNGSIVPNRLAPPVPKPPIIGRSQTQLKPVKLNSNLSRAVTIANTMKSDAPALPPLNPGATSRPLISSPILESTTCLSKELISPFKQSTERSQDIIPHKPAPMVPKVTFELPKSGKSETLPNSTLNVDSDKSHKEGAIKRITSFLKKEEKVDPNAAYRKKTKVKIDRERLKTIEISSPIPCTETETDCTESKGDRISLTRTQSLRDTNAPVMKRVNGSMRARPGSIIGTRPKSPPPPRPPAPPGIINQQKTNGGGSAYKNPPPPKKVEPASIKSTKSNEYDDCEAVEAPLARITEDISPTHSDNIYSVIDEYSKPPNDVPPPPPLSSKSIFDDSANSSVGLLGEIVSEIENRNLNSIYTASTLNRKKNVSNNDKSGNEMMENGSQYVNTSDVNGECEEENYINSKSNSSTTSSGYLRPSAINAPIARVSPVKPLEPMTFKSFKTNSSEPNTGKSENKLTDSLNVKIETKPLSKFINRTPVIGGGTSTSTPANQSIKTNVTSTTKPEKPPFTHKTIGAASTSPTPTKKPLFGRTKTPPSIQQQSVRTRSPSPSKSKLKSDKNTNIPNGIVETIKPKIATVSTKISGNSNATKPKPLEKPTSLTNGTIIMATKSKWQPTVARKLSQTNDTHVASSKINSGSSFLKSASRPDAGKASNVASLQKKFETSNGR